MFEKRYFITASELVERTHCCCKIEMFLSDNFAVVIGGSCLSPSIFNVFINIFITPLKALRCGCCVGAFFSVVFMSVELYDMRMT